GVVMWMTPPQEIVLFRLANAAYQKALSLFPEEPGTWVFGESASPTFSRSPIRTRGTCAPCSEGREQQCGA
ncbi:hypothetical protein NPIL_21221, partial [Nephila pilipes]